nr:spore protease YyaC [Aquibacillus halophilus]
MSKNSTEVGRFNYENPLTPIQMRDTILGFLPESNLSIVIVCIGTDRSTGDSLGPLTGTLLTERKNKNFSVYGTLENPVHALNLRERLSEVHQNNINPFIIAIDACLGKTKSIGTITTTFGPLRPGAAVKKKLPDVGDVSITGVVNISGYMEQFVLQNTRLFLVMQMAKKITNSLILLDRAISKKRDKNTQSPPLSLGHSKVK